MASFDDDLLREIAKQDVKLRKLYDKLIMELAKVGLTIEDVANDEFFSFDSMPKAVRDKVEKILNKYADAMQSSVVNGIKNAITMSFEANSMLLHSVPWNTDIAIESKRKATQKAFVDNRLNGPEGMNLSTRVWNYTQQTKGEFEAGLSQVIEDGIAKGTSAEEIGRRVREKLNNPEMMYRRYHTKKVTRDGTKKDVVEWRRRIVDEDGKVRFIKQDLEHTGRGVYRSARQNALRMAATEINMAYRYSDYELWKDIPTIIGIRIQLSGNHNCKGVPKGMFFDICDELQGDYPKDFKFVGWHPRCRCITTAIMASKKEREKINKLSEDEYKSYKSPESIKTMPDNFMKYINEHSDRIQGAYERGKVPYWIRDNYKERGDITKGFSWERVGKTKFKTDTQKADIQRRWDERRRKNAILVAAEKRHAERNEADILARWEERHNRQRITIKAARNVLKVAGEYESTDPNFSQLKSLIKMALRGGDLSTMSIRTKQLASIVKMIRYEQNQKIKTSVFEGVISDAVKYGKVEYNEVQQLIAKLTDEQIINRIGGGDMMNGSCSSLALAYAGNKGGLDVLDFRDGNSRRFFATRGTIRDIVASGGGSIIEEVNDFVGAKKLFKMMEKGKQYYFACANHAAIVRLEPETGTLQYLELQSPTRNGWKTLTPESTLKVRFAAQKSHTIYGEKIKMSSFLIDIEKLNSDPKYKELMGYINTHPLKQKKGVYGGLR